MAQKLRTADIARKAGVSPATVSRVINHRNLVKQETIDQVEKAMAELGCALKQPAENLETDQGVILVNCPQGTNPFYEEIITGAISSASSHGYRVLLDYEPVNSGTIADFIRLIRKIRAAGVILLGLLSKDLLDTLAKEVPFIQCCEYNKETDYPYVSINDYAAAQSAVSFLIGAGRNKIAFLNGPRNYKYSRERLDGFRDAMAQASLFVPASWILNVPRIDYNMAYTLTTQLFTSAERPNAIFAASDVLAAAAINAARKHHIHVPEDVMVVGFDNIFICQMVRPTITTINQPKEQMGFTACELLAESIEANGLPPRSTLLPTELIIRESAVAANPDLFSGGNFRR